MQVNRVLGIDPGKTWGWATTDGQWGSEHFIGLLDFKGLVANKVEILRPEAVFTCRAMGHSNPAVTRIHGAMGGIVELVCEEMGVAYFDIADSTMRKAVMGKGNAKKAEVMEFTGISDDHAADAMIAAMYGFKMLEKVL